MLSQSHPIYLAHLRLSASKSKSGSDKAILYLTVISMAVLCMQAIIGMYAPQRLVEFVFTSFLIGFGSMNIHVPRNRRPGGPYNVFGIILALCLAVLALYAWIVRYWWVKAKRKRNW